MLKRIVSMLSGNVSYSVAAKPVRGYDAPALATPGNQQLLCFSDIGAATAAGEYNRNAAYLVAHTPQVIIASPNAAATPIPSQSAPQNLIDPTYLLAAFMGKPKP
jgi:hypothetical protein